MRAQNNLLQSPRFFSPDEAIWRIDRELILLAAGGRALLMQLAHPKIAAGVAQHSRFKAAPLARLQRTMTTMWSIVFDDGPVAAAALARLKSIHRQVRGRVRLDEARFIDPNYEALDPTLLLWVHATLIDSALAAYELFVEALTLEEKRLYYEDSKRLAWLFEIPETLVPATLPEFDGYVHATLVSGEARVGFTARNLAAEILHPRSWLLRPLGPLFRLITAGLLPQGLRQGYGLDWSPSKEKILRLFAGGVRSALPLMPAPLRIVPNARRAEKQLSAGRSFQSHQALVPAVSRGKFECKGTCVTAEDPPLDHGSVRRVGRN
ncbi:MAG: oxygenase MpaB family protein, partial [Candidatus Binatia bacterium]